MNIPDLQVLAAGPLPPVHKIRELAGLCWESADNTGDARYSGIARTLDRVASEWDERDGTFSAEVAREIEAAFRRHLISVLEAERPSDGAGLARMLRDEINSALASRWP